MYNNGAWAGIVNEFRGHVHYRSYMQATAGIATTALPELLSNNQQNAPFLDKQIHQMILGEIDDSVVNVLGAINHLPPPPTFQLPDRDVLDGFFSLICQYLWGSEAWATPWQAGGDLRNFVPFCSRVDLVRLRGALTQGARDFLAQHGMAVRQALLTENQRIATFISSKQQSVHPTAIIAEAFIPSVISGNNIDGITGISYQLDVLPTGTHAAPIEFRSIVAHPMPGEIFDAAMTVVDRARALNQGK